MLDSDNLLHVPLYSVIIIGTIIVGILILLVGIVIFLVKKLKSAERVRYGFGGRTIFSIVALMIIALAIPLTLYSTLQTTEIRRTAEAQKEVYIDISSEKLDEANYTVSFMAIPKIDGKVWSKYSYTITWSVEGPVQFKKIEKERDIDNPSYFEKVLPQGFYKVEITVKSEMFTIHGTKEFVLE